MPLKASGPEAEAIECFYFFGSIQRSFWRMRLMRSVPWNGWGPPEKRRESVLVSSGRHKKIP